MNILNGTMKAVGLAVAGLIQTAFKKVSNFIAALF